MSSQRKVPSKKQLLQRRKKAIRLYQDGVPMMEIVRQSGLSWPAVKRAIQLFESGGMDALVPSQRGRREGTGRTLSKEQEELIRNILYRKRPWQVHMKHPHRSTKVAFWNRDFVRDLIQRECGVNLSVRGVGKYLARWGFPLMKPNESPKDQCTNEIQEWLDEHYDSLRQQVYENNTCLFWVRRRKMKVKGYAMLSVVDFQGKEHWIVIKGRYTSKEQVKFLNTLIHYNFQPIILIRNSVDYFFNYDVENFLERHEDKISIVPPLLSHED